MGYDVKKMPSRRYANQNIYHLNVFKAVYPEYDYNFTTNFTDEDDFDEPIALTDIQPTSSISSC